MRWLDPADQARLRALALEPRRPAASAAPGRHRALHRGFTRDFAQHRPYSSGDEARAIDWKAYARLDRYFVREYRAEDRASLVVLLDASASMGFAGPGRPSKLDLARRAAAGLSWIALSQGDEAGLLVVGGAAPAGAPPRAGAAQLAAVDDALSAAAAPAGGEGDLAAALEAAAARLPRRAVVAVVSDLLGDPARVLAALGRLAAGRRGLLVLRVLDPDERDFPYEGALRVDGLEGGSVTIDAGETAAAYREAFARRDDAYRAALRRGGAAYATLTVETPWTSALARLLSA